MNGGWAGGNLRSSFNPAFTYPSISRIWFALNMNTSWLWSEPIRHKVTDYTSCLQQHGFKPRKYSVQRLIIFRVSFAITKGFMLQKGISAPPLSYVTPCLNEERQMWGFIVLLTISYISIEMRFRCLIRIALTLQSSTASSIWSLPFLVWSREGSTPGVRRGTCICPKSLYHRICL